MRMSETGRTRPVAMVTGARRGMGRAISIALAKRGYDIIGVDITMDGARDTGLAVVEAGGNFDFRLADLSRPEAIEPLAEYAWAACGGVEALVNNAGVQAMQRGDPLEASLESWDRALSVNTRAPFLLTQAVAKRMVAADAPKRGPRGVVFISSVNALLASVNRVEYCASKAATAMLAKVFALRLAEDGIPVFDIRPGVIRTDMTAPVADAYSEQIAAGAISPMRRWGEPEDVAKAIGGLITGEIPFSTGAAFYVDGGLHIPRF
jgi:NAD(P)-dependent dehydrogenase (short-subunit alcohol dehydrogenase family)